MDDQSEVSGALIADEQTFTTHAGELRNKTRGFRDLLYPLQGEITA